MAQDAAKEVEALVEEKYALAEKGDYFKLLGAGPHATNAQLRTAYFSLVKRIHPDRLPKLGLTALVPRASKLFQAVTRAYETLSNSESRAEYEKGTLRAVTPSSPTPRNDESNRKEAGKIAFHKGTVMLNKRAFGKAEPYLREATDADDTVARYWQSLGWAIFANEVERDEEQRLEAARECFEKALKLDEDDAMTHYNIGLYWKAKGSSKRHRLAMQRAVECKPNFVEAKRELRLIKQRTGKDTDPRSDRAKGGSKKPAPTSALGKFWAYLNQKR
jgi:curved DNA-binding protein CbpA